jgi:hypothetical protein
MWKGADMKAILYGATATVAALVAVPASAGTLVINGDTTGDPTYNRLLTTTSLSAVGVANPYEVTSFTVGANGSYTVALDSLDFDTFVSLYSPTFTPGNPLANVLAVDDDGGPGFNSLITFSLTAGVNYLAVATGFDPSDFGAYTMTINGPGEVLPAAPAVPEPASWAMMISGFGLVGGAMRRRAMKVSYAG